MQKTTYIFFSVFLLDVYPGLGISEIRHLFFRGPIWMRLKNRGSFCVGQVPGTSHVATRPKKQTCERRICPSLSRPFAAFSSRPRLQFVRGCPKRPWCHAYIRCTGSSFSSFPPPLSFFCFGRPVLKKKTGVRGKNIVCCCLLYQVHDTCDDGDDGSWIGLCVVLGILTPSPLPLSLSRSLGKDATYKQTTSYTATSTTTTPVRRHGSSHQLVISPRRFPD